MSTVYLHVKILQMHEICDADSSAGERIPTLEQVVKQFASQAHIHLVRSVLESVKVLSEPYLFIHCTYFQSSDEQRLFCKRT